MDVPLRRLGAAAVGQKESAAHDRRLRCPAGGARSRRTRRSRTGRRVTPEWLERQPGLVQRRRGQGDHARSATSLVMHFFNHQTHHRGQAHALLTAAGAEAGTTDLPAVVVGQPVIVPCGKASDSAEPPAVTSPSATSRPRNPSRWARTSAGRLLGQVVPAVHRRAPNLPRDLSRHSATGSYQPPILPFAAHSTSIGHRTFRPSGGRSGRAPGRSTRPPGSPLTFR